LTSLIENQSLFKQIRFKAQIEFINNQHPPPNEVMTSVIVPRSDVPTSLPVPASFLASLKRASEIAKHPKIGHW
jgi:hypothetical protein